MPLRLRIALAMGGAGVMTCLFVLGPEFWIGPTAEDYWVVLWFLAASAVGAALSGLATAALFGRPDGPGWLRAAIGSVAATALGGAIGGTLVFPGYGTVLGAAFVFMSMLKTPLIAPVWTTAMIAVHLYARHLRSAAAP